MTNYIIKVKNVVSYKSPLPLSIEAILINTPWKWFTSKDINFIHVHIFIHVHECIKLTRIQYLPFIQFTHIRITSSTNDWSCPMILKLATSVFDTFPFLGFRRRICQNLAKQTFHRRISSQWSDRHSLLPVYVECLNCIVWLDS